MDHEIEIISQLHPAIGRDLQRNHKTGCLEYIGIKRGNISGNPLVLIRKNGKATSTHLRRWIWKDLHHKPLSKNQFVVMTCKRGNCMAISYMDVSSKFHRYHKHDFFSDHPDYPRENILLIKYFKGFIPALRISKWFKVPRVQVERIWNGTLFPEIIPSKNYLPPRS